MPHFRSIFLLLTLTSLVAAADRLPLSTSYWKDEAFLKAFNGSYRINSRTEPTVSSEVRGLLVSIQTLMATGKREEALRKLTSSPLAKTSPAVQFNIGNIHFELGEMEKAAAAYQAALKTYPTFLRAYRNLGFVHARENDWKLAVPAFEQAIKLGDQSPATYGQLAYGRLHSEQYATALQTFRLAQVTDANNVDWKAGVAQCLQHLSRNREALALIEEVIRARPNETSYYLLQSSIYLSLDQPADAIVNLELVRRMKQLDAESHLLLASLHLRSGNHALARPLLLGAVTMEKKPPHQSALNALDFTIQTVRDAPDWKLAQDFASAIVAAWPNMKDPELATQQKRLGAIIDIQSGANPERGAASLEAIVQAHPLDAASLIHLGKFRVQKKQYQQAIMLFEQAARIENHAYSAHLELAKANVATNNYSAALKHLDAALKINPTPEIKEYRSAIQNLHQAR